LFQDVFADAGRLSLLSQVKIETALAVPVFSGKSTTPSFVFSCYSFVKTGSVPFVLKFVQQALRLLWDGLDKVQPHRSVGEDLWRDVAPADLGEMAADVEMQQHFMIKKRPHAAIEVPPAPQNAEDATLTLGFQAMGTPSGVQPVRSIYTGTLSGMDDYFDDDFEPNVVLPIQYQPYQTAQSVQQAVESVRNLKPVHERIPTNDQGSKRAHILIERLDSPVEFDTSTPQQRENPAPMNFIRPSGMSAASPLPMPPPLPLPASLGQHLNSAHQAIQHRIQPLQNQPSAYMQQTMRNQVQTHEMHNQQQSYSAPGNFQLYQQQAHDHQSQQSAQPENERQYAPQGQFSSTVQPSYGMHFDQPQSQQQADQPSSHSQLQYDSQGQLSNSGHRFHYSQQYQPSQTSTPLNFSQQHLIQAQPQQRQQYMPSSEPLSLPSDYKPSPYNHINNMQSSTSQPNFSSNPTSKISATGMVFHVPPSSQAPPMPHNVNVVGQGAMNGASGMQFCQTVDPASMPATTGKGHAKVCTA
jgi:hypothetical protein